MFQIHDKFKEHTRVQARTATTVPGYLDLTMHSVAWAICSDMLRKAERVTCLREQGAITPKDTSRASLLVSARRLPDGEVVHHPNHLLPYKAQAPPQHQTEQL